MYITVMAFTDGARHAAVTRTVKQADDWRGSVSYTTGNNVIAWRMHDGKGWCRGSADAHMHITELPSRAVIEVFR